MVTIKKHGLEIAFIGLTFGLLSGSYIDIMILILMLIVWIAIALWIAGGEIQSMLLDYMSDKIKAQRYNHIIRIATVIIIVVAILLIVQALRIGIST